VFHLVVIEESVAGLDAKSGSLLYSVWWHVFDNLTVVGLNPTQDPTAGNFSTSWARLFKRKFVSNSALIYLGISPSGKSIDLTLSVFIPGRAEYKMRSLKCTYPAMPGLGNSCLPAISTNCIAIYINSMELLAVCIVCMHFGEQFVKILPIWGEFSYFFGADIFLIKSVEIMKLMVVFYSLHVFPWIPGEKNFLS
jgi:hypothetical protein